MTNDVPIYSLIGAPVIGELGDASVVDRFPECAVCERRPPAVIRSIELVLDFWSGEELIAVAGHNYLVSARLREALERERITGVAFDPVRVTRSQDFEVVPPAKGRTAPDFFRMAIFGRADGPELWWTSATCPVCGVTSWSPTSEGIAAQAAGLGDGDPVPREVYISSWTGNDVFRVPDPGPPLVTQRFVDLVDGIAVRDVYLTPARWIEG